MPDELQLSDSDSSKQVPVPTPANLPLATASWCVRRGWPVHPLAPGRKTPAANCSDCRRKTHAPADCACLPAGRWCHGFHAATLREDRVQQWWGGHPEFGIGVSCGPAGLLVIDIDAHGVEPPTRDRLLPGIHIADQVDLTGLANGFHTLGVLAALRGAVSPANDETTLRVRTPSGGVHVWYRASDGPGWHSSVGSSPRRALAWQVDIRAFGSYIIAPGTTTVQGTYTALGDVREPSELPLWLAQELTRTGHLRTPSCVRGPRSTPHRAHQAVQAAGGTRDTMEHVLKAILSPVEDCGLVAEGAAFSHVLNRAAYTIGGLIAAGRCPQDEAVQALQATAVLARPGQERRIEQIIRSGLAAGLSKPLPASRRSS